MNSEPDNSSKGPIMRHSSRNHGDSRLPSCLGCLTAPARLLRGKRVFQGVFLVLFSILLLTITATQFEISSMQISTPNDFSSRAPNNLTGGISGAHSLRERHQIPRILHQSWKSHSVPEKFKFWQGTWKSHHPGWVYKLWTDEDNVRLVKEHLPWYYDRFMAYPRNINRADAARIVYMYIFGGLYADLDIECLRSHDDLARKGGLILGQMSDDYEFDNNIPNAWMMSSPGHPFWLFALEKLNQVDPSTDLSTVENVAGPIFLFNTIKEFQKIQTSDMPPVYFMEPGLIYPYDWHNQKGFGHICSAQSERFDPQECKTKIDPEKKAYTITYWSHSWGSTEALQNMRKPFQDSSSRKQNMTETEEEKETGESFLQQIPRILHTIAPTSSYSHTQLGTLKGFERSCQQLHPGWMNRMWAATENEDLVKTQLPWFYDRYKSYPSEMNRTQAIRYVYMYLFGGFVLDPNVECMKPLTHLSEAGGVVVSKHPTISVLGAPPGHPFFKFLLEKLRDNRRLEAYSSDKNYPMTGPSMFYETLKEYQDDFEKKTYPAIHIMDVGTLTTDDPWKSDTSGPVYRACGLESAQRNVSQCHTYVNPNGTAYTVLY